LRRQIGGRGQDRCILEFIKNEISRRVGYERHAAAGAQKSGDGNPFRQMLA
jgi:hypothetical protein